MLEEGDKLPALRLPDQDGKTRTLADLAGEKGLILYVYPKDLTPGCTVEATDFNDRLGVLRAAGWGLAGLSKDPAESHCRFIAEHGLAFPLLTDADGSYLEKIGAWGEKKLYGRVHVGIKRSTFVIGKDGVVQKAFSNVRAKGHAARMVRELGLD